MQIPINGFSDVLFQFMKIDDTHAEFVIQSIEKSYKTVCGRSFVAYDVYASFARKVLLDRFSFVVQEIAANIIRFIAWDVNRYSAQHMIEEIINEGIEPILEEIIRD